MRGILVIGVRGQVGFELRRALQPMGEVVGADADLLGLAHCEAVIQFLADLRARPHCFHRRPHRRRHRRRGGASGPCDQHRGAGGDGGASTALWRSARSLLDRLGARRSQAEPYVAADSTVQVLRGVLAERAGGTFRSEVVHATASDVSSWPSVAERILELSRVLSLEAVPAKRVVPIATRDYPTPAWRPVNSRLDCSRITKPYGINLAHREVGLKLCMEELA